MATGEPRVEADAPGGRTSSGAASVFTEADEIVRSFLSLLARPEHVADGLDVLTISTQLEVRIGDLAAAHRRMADAARERGLSGLVVKDDGARPDIPVFRIVDADVAAEVRRTERALADRPAVGSTTRASEVEPPSEELIATDPDVVVYGPGEDSRPGASAYARTVWRRRRFMSALARSQIKAQHQDTALGWVWRIVNPLLSAGVYFILITLLRPQDQGDSMDRFTLLVASVFLFTFTRSALDRAAISVTSNQNLLANLAFPRILLPGSEVLRALMELAPGIAVYAVIHLVAGQPVEVALILFPVVLSAQVVFTAGLAMVVSSLTVFVRDLPNLLSFFTRLWFFVTPVLYTLADLERQSETTQRVMRANPLFPTFEAYHLMLSGVMPDPAQVAASAAWASGALVLGFRLFARREHRFAMHV